MRGGAEAQTWSPATGGWRGGVRVVRGVGEVGWGGRWVGGLGGWGVGGLGGWGVGSGGGWGGWGGWEGRGQDKPSR